MFGFASNEDTNKFWLKKKNSNLHLRKMQISFNVKKIFRSTSEDDADLFYCEEKFRSTSKEDADLFYFKKKSCSHADYWHSRKRL